LTSRNLRSAGQSDNVSAGADADDQANAPQQPVAYSSAAQAAIFKADCETQAAYDALQAHRFALHTLEASYRAKQQAAQALRARAAEAQRAAAHEASVAEAQATAEAAELARPSHLAATSGAGAAAVADAVRAHASLAKGTTGTSEHDATRHRGIDLTATADAAAAACGAYRRACCTDGSCAFDSRIELFCMKPKTGDTALCRPETDSKARKFSALPPPLNSSPISQLRLRLRLHLHLVLAWLQANKLPLHRTCACSVT
jgi:hypothetical protein